MMVADLKRNLVFGQRRISRVVAYTLLLTTSACSASTNETGAETETAARTKPAAETSAELGSPPCSDAEVTDLLRDVVDTHMEYDAEVAHKLTAVTEIRELGSVMHREGKWRSTRSCAAKGTLSNAEEVNLWYQLLTPMVDYGIGYRISPCMSKYDVAHKDCSAFERVPKP